MELLLLFFSLFSGCGQTSGTNLAMAVNTHAGGGDGAFGGEGGIVVGGGEWGAESGGLGGGTMPHPGG